MTLSTGPVAYRIATCSREAENALGRWATIALAPGTIAAASTTVTSTDLFTDAEPRNKYTAGRSIGDQRLGPVDDELLEFDRIGRERLLADRMAVGAQQKRHQIRVHVVAQASRTVGGHRFLDLDK